MKAFAIVSDENPGIGFVVKVDEKDYERAKEIALEGFGRWNDAEEYPEYEQVGYAEPSEKMLKEAGIECEIDSYYEEDETGDPYILPTDYEEAVCKIKPEYEGIEEVGGLFSEIDEYDEEEDQND